MARHDMEVMFAERDIRRTNSFVEAAGRRGRRWRRKDPGETVAFATVLVRARGGYDGRHRRDD